MAYLKTLALRLYDDNPDHVELHEYFTQNSVSDRRGQRIRREMEQALLAHVRANPEGTNNATKGTLSDTPGTLIDTPNKKKAKQKKAEGTNNVSTQKQSEPPSSADRGDVGDDKANDTDQTRADVKSSLMSQLGYSKGI